ncbi:MAG: hypothetical protein ACO20H_03075 [Bacteriovoracaceae bacterium]
MKTIIIIYFLLSVPAYSFDWRELASKLLGQQWSSRLFPKDIQTKEITFPKLPGKTNKGGSLKNTHAQKMGHEQKQKYDYVFLNEVFKVTRLGEISDPELMKWFNVLSQQGSREGVYHALVLDSTYYNLEQKEYPTHPKLARFIPTHLEKYTKSRIKESQLKQLNFFLVKRVVIDKYIGLIDQFTDYDDLSTWYAFLSSDLSKSFNHIFKSSIRKNHDLMTHKKWALSVSKDLLKSEVYIKLHTVMNYLNYSDQKQ